MRLVLETIQLLDCLLPFLEGIKAVFGTTMYSVQNYTVGKHIEVRLKSPRSLNGKHVYPTEKNGLGRRWRGRGNDLVTYVEIIAGRRDNNMIMFNVQVLGRRESDLRSYLECLSQPCIGLSRRKMVKNLCV